MVADTEASKKEQSNSDPTITEVADAEDDKNSQQSEIDLEDILLDEQKVTAIQNTINEADIAKMVQSHVEAVEEEETDFD